MNFLLFIFEAIAEMSSCKNVNSLSPFSEEELHIEQNVEKKTKDKCESPGLKIRFIFNYLYSSSKISESWQVRALHFVFLC